MVGRCGHPPGHTGGSKACALGLMILFRGGILRQKVVIRAVVHRHGKVLLLRRHGGRPSIAGKYELPGGSLHLNEQPSDALKRSLQIHAGIEPESFTLRDTVSFLDPDRRDLQYIFIVYDVTLPMGRDARVTLDDEYHNYVWADVKTVNGGLLTNSTKVILNIGTDAIADPDFVAIRGAEDDGVKTLVIHSDGGSRGNPGPSASAYVIMDTEGQMVAQGGRYLGWNDSGMAEYIAVELALKKAIELKADVVEYYSDSLMVVNQINGVFKVKNPEFKDIHDRVIKLLFNFRRVKFTHVHREYNRIADSLVNRILDENEGSNAARDWRG